jgi:hypothetical protein
MMIRVKTLWKSTTLSCIGCQLVNTVKGYKTKSHGANISNKECFYIEWEFIKEHDYSDCF